MTTPLARLRLMLAILAVVAMAAAWSQPSNTATGFGLTVASVLVALACGLTVIVPRHPAVILVGGAALCGVLVGRSLEAAAVEQFSSVAWLASAGVTYVALQGVVMPLTAMVEAPKK